MNKLIEERGWIYEEGEDLYKKRLPSGKNNPLYQRWQHIKSRCYNRKNVDYKYYGGRGITMCDEWRNSSRVFIGWCINHPTFKPGLEIDRIDNDGNYCPENCRFVTHNQNMQNRGECKGVIEHCKRIGKIYGKINIKFATAAAAIANSKKVISLEDKKIFSSVSEACRETGINTSSISRCCLRRKHYNTAGGYKWMFYKDFLEQEEQNK